MAEGHGETRASVPANRVLLMDDEEIILDVVSRILVRMGYEVGTATDGKEAVEKYKTAREDGVPYDIVILDMNVNNGMNGLDAIGLLLEEDPGVVAIVSSGYASDPVIENFQEYGFKGAIAKPYTPTELGKCIDVALAVVRNNVKV